jgi:predicted phosphoribosyltransferase
MKRATVVIAWLLLLTLGRNPDAPAIRRQLPPGPARRTRIAENMVADAGKPESALGTGIHRRALDVRIRSNVKRSRERYVIVVDVGGVDMGITREMPGNAARFRLDNLGIAHPLIPARWRSANGRPSRVHILP